MAKNNLNLIENDLVYELFIWNKNWEKIGEKICENNRVTFSGIQKNAILYLACKSKDVESTMCWNEDNKPYWVVIRDYDKNN